MVQNRADVFYHLKSKGFSTIKAQQLMKISSKALPGHFVGRCYLDFLKEKHEISALSL